MSMEENSIPSIEDYGLIGDCHSSALISKQGSIDWCCMPRFDSASCFGRLLDWHKAGFCQISPTSAFKTSRRYLDNSMILETSFQTDEGEVRLIDLFTMRRGGEHHPYHQLLRMIKPIRGTMELKVSVMPRFDYGAIKPWIRQYSENSFIAIGGCDGLLISTNLPICMDCRDKLTIVLKVNAQQNYYLSIIYAKPEDLDECVIYVPTLQQQELRFSETVDWWEGWNRQVTFQGKYTELALRSAMVLKCLCYAPTGAIIAAPTTSLPESLGGSRNWDYRYSWVRDSCFSVRALEILGFIKEADGFRRFIERSCAGSATELQTLFGVDGRRHIFERTLDDLDGYRGSKPVRVGNAAHQQLQLDVYGELLLLAWRWHEQGCSPDDDYWLFLTGIVDTVIEIWESPDCGIWEVRSEPRHFVFSKAMCWVTLDRGIRLAISMNKNIDLENWKKVRDKIRQSIEEHGYDADRGVFTQAFGFPQMDASLLLLSFFDFISYQDPRMIRTVEAIRKELDRNGLLMRYPSYTDELEGEEGVFLACTFWLVTCLARQGQLTEAEEIFIHAISTGNDLGLFSEEYFTKSQNMGGNFPQALTHLSVIAAIIALNEKTIKKKS